MSIDDLTSMDLTPALAIMAIILIVTLPIGIAWGKKANNSIYGDNEYGETDVEKNARIIARRTTPHPLTQTVMVNMVVFELENGNRVELAIKDPNTYGTMVEGDSGTLRYQGKKFVSFERNA